MKILITNYSFDASGKTITFNDYTSILLERVLLITNVTDNVIIYNFADPNKGGTVSDNVLTLTYDTTSMSDTDKLQIFYDDPDVETPINDGGNSITVDGSVSIGAALPAGTNTIGKVKLVDPSGDEPEWADTTNNAIRVNVVAGGAGGGVAQTQVRNSTNVWTDVGYYTGNLNMPVEVKTALPAGTNNIGDIDVLTYPGPSSSQFPAALTASGNLKTAIQEATTLTVQATDLDIRNLTKTLDEIYSVLRTDAGVAYDARQIRALTSSDVVSAVQLGTWNIGTVTTLTGITNVVHVDDNAGSLTVDGTVSIGSALPAGTNKIGSVDIASALPAGTNNIGDVDVLTLPSLPAGTNTIGNVKITDGTDTALVDSSGNLMVNLGVKLAATTDNITAYSATDAIYNGNTALTPKFAAIAAATSGDNTLVSAVSGKKIRVLALSAVVSAATNIYFTSGAAGTVIFGGSTNKINLAANSGLVLGFNPVGWFETASGQALVVNLSAGNSFSGGLVYIEV